MNNHLNYNPDVLSCLANLSNDEVFTPPQLANQMLDMLPQELFRSPETKFLDPCTKSGVFLREIAKRLIDGLAEQIPDLQERIDHIMHHQLYGIAITQLTSMMSRRSLYCTKDASGKYSLSHFDDTAGNIRYAEIKHSWQNGRCRYCGASQEVYDRGEDLESHAYEFIHKDNPNTLYNNMTFDVIIGNPPYQLNVGVEKENYAIAIYDKFINQAKKLSPRHLVMIIPARWYAGGRGLDEFRDNMLHDNRLRVIHDFPESVDCFPGVEIQGGVCYFRWDRDNPGMCKVYTHMKEKIKTGEERPLLEKGCETFIRYNESVSILRKVQAHNEMSFSTFVSTQTPFGIITSYKGTPTKKRDTDLKMYISGNEKEYKGGSAFCPFEKVTKGHEMISWHKVFISKAYGGGMAFPHMVLGKPFYGEPNSICNQSYLVLGEFDNEVYCKNVITYIKTKFFRFMVLQRKNAQDAMRQVYQFVPLQDFSKPWTDEELYKKYNLTEEEIAFIESMIRPMD